MTTYDTGNGQSDVKHDGNPDPKPDEKPAAKQDEKTDKPKKLTLAEQKAKWAREAEATRVGLQAEIDQLEAEIVTIETTAGTQIAEINEDIKQLKAEMRNIGGIHDKAEKVVTVPGPAAVAAPKAPKKGRGR
jgi:ethanolamine utilization cobalamin adenosyltransferase